MKLKNKLFQTHLKYLIPFLALIIFFIYLLNLKGYYGGWLIKSIEFGFIVFIIASTILAKNKEIKSKYWVIKLFIAGFLSGLIYGILIEAYNYYSASFINKNIIFESINTPSLRSELKMEGLDDEMITNTIHEMSRMISPRIIFITNFIFLFVISLVSSTIFSYFITNRTKKNDTNSIL